MKEIVTAFTIDQEVTIKSFKLVGFVNQILIDRSGFMYQVVYYYEGSRKLDWFYANELSSETKCGVKIGFSGGHA